MSNSAGANPQNFNRNRANRLAKRLRRFAWCVPLVARGGVLTERRIRCQLVFVSLLQLKSVSSETKISYTVPRKTLPKQSFGWCRLVCVSSMSPPGVAIYSGGLRTASAFCRWAAVRCSMPPRRIRMASIFGHVLGPFALFLW